MPARSLHTRAPLRRWEAALLFLFLLPVAVRPAEARSVHPIGSQSQDSGTIKGSVVYADGSRKGLPLPFVLVALEGETPEAGPWFRVTNRHGVFLFTGLEAGRYRLSAHKADHLCPGATKVRLRPGAWRELVLKIRTTGESPAATRRGARAGGGRPTVEGTIQGYVMVQGRERDTRPARAVEVTLEAESGGMGTRTSTTDERGFFRFSSVPTGMYRLSARNGEHTSVPREGISILEEALRELVLTLRGRDRGPEPPERP